MQCAPGSFQSGVGGEGILKKSFTVLERRGKRRPELGSANMSWWLFTEAKNSYLGCEGGLTLGMNVSLVMAQSHFLSGD